MKLFYASGACSLGIHVMLEEIGRPYQAEAIKMKEGAQHKPPFVEMNPKAKVPVLQLDDGAVLTEYGAIAHYILAGSALLPAAPLAMARAIEAQDYIVATIHMQGFARIARSENFSPDPATHDAVKARGREIYAKGMAMMDKTLDGREWLVGDYSFADPTLFYASNWASRAGVDLPANVARHNAAMRARPAVQAVLDAEGLPR